MRGVKREVGGVGGVGKVKGMRTGIILGVGGARGLICLLCLLL